MKSRLKCTLVNWSKKTVVCFTILVLLGLCHFLLLPNVFGHYNKQCMLSSTEKEDLQYLLKSVISALENNNVTYWLDYGTLLGAYRYGDVIPWDGDGDISILKSDSDEKFDAVKRQLDLNSISANPMIADYKSASIDIMRWTVNMGMYKGKLTPLMHKYYPGWVKDNLIVKMQHKLDAFPLKWLFPLKRLKFLGVDAHVPYETEKFLGSRYSFTLHFRFPYKWKCWLPIFK